MIVNVSFDSSVNSAPTGFVSTVNAVAQFFGAAFSDNVTINLSVGFGEVAGQAVSALGESITQLNTYSYAALRSALIGDSKSADDSSSAATLPVTTPSSGAAYWVPRAEAKALGLLGASSSSDGSIGFSSNAGIFDYDRTDGITAGHYDFFAVVAHELTEVMGRQLMTGETFGGHTNSLEPMDLFHYSSAGARSFVGTQAGYFSADGGTTNLDNFNINPGGDFGDWAASAGNDAFLAFGKSGVINAVSDADLRVMDVLGWDRVTAATPPSPPAPASPAPPAPPPPAPPPASVAGQPHWIASTDIGTHPAGYLPTSAGDFNHDGTSDLVWYNSTTRDLDLWKLSNGKWAGSVDIGAHPAGYLPSTSGDFNGDGTSDVLWFNPTSGNVDIWKISNGQWAGSISVGAHPLGWQPAGSGDFNGDGTSDVLWYNPTNGDAEVWKLANAQWAGSTDLGVHALGWQPIGTGDFDHSGTSDVLWYNPTTRDLDVWKISNGQPAVDVDIGTHPAGYAPAGIGDFNNDGTSDVLWFNATSGDTEVWLIANGHWSGSVDLGVHPAGWTPAGIGDFNHDGTTDIAWRETATNHVETWLLAAS
jgi:hypothetical protein